MRWLTTSVMALSIALASSVSFAAEPAVFIDLKDIALPEAAEFVARITKHRIELGPGAEGRITMSTPRALTYDEVLEAFDAELARNGMTAIKRGREMLIVPAQPSRVAAAPRTAVPASTTPAASASASPITIVTPMLVKPPVPASVTISYVDSNVMRARALIRKLLEGGVTARLTSGDEDNGYTIEIEVPADAAARAELARRLAALDLSALFAMPT